MSLVLKPVCVWPTFLVIFIMQPLRDVKNLSMVGVEGMITDSQHWSNAKQHVVSNEPNDYVYFQLLLLTKDIDVCVLEPEAGNCRGSFLRYFYNKFTGRCELFVYGGCGGNGNRFVDIHICKKTCLSGYFVTL